jgi:hypothetical protein
MPDCQSENRGSIPRMSAKFISAKLVRRAPALGAGGRKAELRAETNFMGVEPDGTADFS